ncbi:cell wall-binding repeat-containing protein [Clostridiaceae bacterium UIB06]|uniref:Cell wall-binding repeat-containing protein n=1 Tax=Clostridium thailandense TaxID=2794346 RepID=A0A949U0C6_9CLOT|nr:cell wall-binding repeat-containing protein [Clostridium thailandense]MBV7273929.1 cell wall-binding repeat-containing protein [Clostridium thailandense]MCH5137211.1 cell wall-binding repeat-containing protein [Clostridiaceae bacterium UIB06]
MKKLFTFFTAALFFVCLQVAPFNVHAEGTGKTYYVSQNRGTGTGDYGTINNPFSKIQDAIDHMKPGDTLLIREGTYHETTDVYDKNGSSNAWYTIKNYPNESVVMTGDNLKNMGGKDGGDAITFAGSSYWKVEGLTIENYTGAGIYITRSYITKNTSSNIELNKLTIHDLDYPEYRPYGTSGVYGDEISSNCIVKNCEIYNVGLKINKPKDHGIYIGYGASNWTFSGNKIHDNAGAAIQMYGSPNGGSNCTIQNNILYNNRAYGMAIGSSATNNYINNNVFYGNAFDDIYMLEGAVKNYFRNNLFLSRYSNYNVQLSDEGSIDNSFDNNTYYKVNGIVLNRYDKTLTFDEWKSYSEEYSGQYINDENTAEALIRNWTPVSGKKYSSIRLSGQDRFETSVKIAEAFNNGAVDSIVITSGYDFPNALSGSVLAAKLNAPILLSGNSNPRNLKTIEYIINHLPKNGYIYILGDESDVTNDIVTSLNSLGYLNIKRLKGDSKYETIKAINDKINAQEGTPLIVAGGNVFADGLSISSVAASKGYPIILSDSEALSDSAIQTIQKVKPSKVYIIGGTSAISDYIKTQIQSITKLSDDDVCRIWGSDRYETSLNISKYFNLNSDTVTFASGENFPDALAGSVYAAKYNSPLILVSGDIKNQKAYVDEKDFVNQVIFGGTGVIGENLRISLSK